jgi:hypothetical protein
MPGKKIPERRSCSHPSEKELLEWYYGTFFHKNSPGSSDIGTWINTSNFVDNLLHMASVLCKDKVKYI